MADFISLAALLAKSTTDAIKRKLLSICDALGLQTETWHPGDPTRTVLDAVARLFGQDDGFEDLIGESLRGRYLDLATGNWLTLLARYGFNVTRRGASYATTTLRLTNASGAVYVFDSDDLTAKNSATGATYRNSTAGTLLGNSTLDLVITAEVGGADSTSAIGEIDALVSSLPNVTCTNILAAVGQDEEEDEALRIRCRAKLQSISPAGPKGAYDYIATTPELNGGANVTRSRTFGNKSTGVVRQYLANAAGGVSGGDVALVADAIERLANPLCFNYIAASAVNVVVPVTYELWVYSTISQPSSDVAELVEDALLTEITRVDIGGDIIPPALTGTLYQGRLEAAILAAVAPHGFRVIVTAPAGDVPLDNDEVATLGVVTATIHLISR